MMNLPVSGDDFEDPDDSVRQEADSDKSLFDSGRIEAEDLSDDNLGAVAFDLDNHHDSMIVRNQNFTYSSDEEKRDHFFSSLINYGTN